ncbi:MAG: prepilin-type N-terminal cleavage/methylation domain-containing protein [Patescibacteria group bacterium]|nr:prepilin-type N-terminal cleavage/methylation domain-containing protein [Patescibacteria group bacterium]
MAITKIKKNKFGFALIEMSVAILIIGIALASLSQLAISALKTINSSEQEELALSLAREGMEAARSFRDNTDWNTQGPGSLTAGLAYHPEISIVSASTTWAMAAGSENIGAFSREINFDNVSRDPTTANIETAYNAANHDSDTKLVTVAVAAAEKNILLKAYLTNWH